MVFLASIVGVGIISALMLYFSFKLDEEHFILKILAMIVAFVLLATIPSFSIQSLEECDYYINNTHSVGGVQNYSYVRICDDNNNNASIAFMNVYYGFLILLFLYISIVVVLKSLEYINKTAVERKTRK